jgi:hypothetical protein
LGKDAAADDTEEIRIFSVSSAAVVTEKTNKSSNFPAAMKQSLGLIALIIFVALITLVLAATQVSPK